MSCLFEISKHFSRSPEKASTSLGWSFLHRFACLPSLFIQSIIIRFQIVLHPLIPHHSVIQCLIINHRCQLLHEQFHDTLLLDNSKTIQMYPLHRNDINNRHAHNAPVRKIAYPPKPGKELPSRSHLRCRLNHGTAAL